MLFIGEIGINHNGDLNTALELIKQAKECGVDVVKFQKRDPDLCVPEEQKNQERIWKGKEMTYLEYKHDIEFWEEEYDAINSYCKKLGIKWTASVWDINSVEFMKRYTADIPFIKIPSACITDMELLNAINDWGVDVVFSDGMSTISEVKTAHSILKNKIGLLHCNSSYPCREDEIDLKVIDMYRHMQWDKNIVLGYSGHESGYFPTLIAYTMDIGMIERHITLDKNMEGSDHKSSLDMSELKELMHHINRIDTIRGKFNKVVYDSEKESRKKLRTKRYKS